MASSDRAAVERLALSDLPDCLALSTQAGWNQVEADWRLFFDQGLVWGIRYAGSVVASAALLPYPPRTAWISMVLTAERARGEGFANRLTAAAIDESGRRKLLPQLDATPQGEPIYRQLGLQKVAHLTRWRWKPESETQPSPCSATALQPDLGQINRIDAQSIGFERPGVLRELLARGPAAAVEGAFALSRDGRTAYHIGPVVAERWEMAEVVLSKLGRRLGTRRAVIIDANENVPSLARWLAAHGFRRERPFLRMAKGAAPRCDLTRYLAAAGPELG